MKLLAALAIPAGITIGIGGASMPPDPDPDSQHPDSQHPGDTAPDGWALVWSDEFAGTGDGAGIDRENWTFDIGGGGWGNGEAQYYTDRARNARVEDGNLIIELHQERYADNYYTSARLLTQGLREFQYGRVEARAQVPRGAGTWPALWMLGADFDSASDDPAHRWPDIGEIDIMEHVGREPDLTIGALHGPGYAGAGGFSRYNRRDHDIADDFHIFAVEWDADGIAWFYDDEVFWEVERDIVGDREWVFDRPMFIIVNLALGGTLGGTIALDLELPVQYRIDYVRVYQPIGAGGE